MVSEESLLCSVGGRWGNCSGWTLAFVSTAGVVRLCIMFLVHAVMGQKSVLSE